MQIPAHFPKRGQFLLQGGNIITDINDGSPIHGCIHAPAAAQPRQDLLLGAPAQAQNQERIFIKAVTQDIVNCRHMLAGVGVIGTGTVCPQVR